MLKSVVHICHSLDDGGIAAFVRSLTNSERQLDPSHAVCSITSKPAVELTCSNIALGFKWRRFAAACVYAFRKLREYDFFFVHAPHPVIVIPLLVFGRRRTFLFQHGMTASQGSRVRRSIKKAWYSLVPVLLGAKVVCSTQTARQKLDDLGIRISDKRITYVPFGVSVPETKPTQAMKKQMGDVIRFGMAGRLVPEKRFDLVINSLANIDVSRRFDLKIAGDGPARAALERHAKDVETANVKVRFLGQVVEMAEFYRDIDLFIHPGKNESLGLVVVEALAHQVPVLVFDDVGGAMSVVTDNVNGITLHGKEALARFWCRIDEKPELLATLQHNATSADPSILDISRTRAELERLAASHAG